MRPADCSEIEIARSSRARLSDENTNRYRKISIGRPRKRGARRVVWNADFNRAGRDTPAGLPAARNLTAEPITETRRELTDIQKDDASFMTPVDAAGSASRTGNPPPFDADRGVFYPLALPMCGICVVVSDVGSGRSCAPARHVRADRPPRPQRGGAARRRAGGPGDAAAQRHRPRGGRPADLQRGSIDGRSSSTARSTTTASCATS